MDGRFVPQYQGPSRRPPGTLHVDQLIVALLDHGMSMSEISELLGESGHSAAYDLARFVDGKSEYFTKDEGCERLEQALAEIKAHPGTIPQYQGPSRRPPGTLHVEQLIVKLLDEIGRAHV